MREPDNGTTPGIGETLDLTGRTAVVRDHVAEMARPELRLARRTVTGWERRRGFETA